MIYSNNLFTDLTFFILYIFEHTTPDRNRRHKDMFQLDFICFDDQFRYLNVNGFKQNGSNNQIK